MIAHVQQSEAVVQSVCVMRCPYFSRDSQRNYHIHVRHYDEKKLKHTGKEKKLHDGSYFWPLTADGDSQRVRFCQRMARLCMKKRKN